MLANALVRGDGTFCVERGSTADGIEKQINTSGWRNYRRALIDNDTLVPVPDGDNMLTFARPAFFASLSEAATICLGYHVSGRLYWKVVK